VRVSAQALLAEIQSFLQSSSASTALNLDEQSTADEKKTRQTDAGKVAIILPFTMLSEPPRDAASTHGDAPAHPPSLQPQASPSLARDQWLIERSRDSWTHIWSCTNVMDREWVRSKLHAAAGGDCKLMFIELVVSDQRLVQEQISSLQPASRPVFKELHALHARAYTPLSRSASPEARLSYLRLLNFRDIETHRMHGFLRMRIAQFLSVLRPSRHTVYLSRHGESTYNVEKKLGGNPGLSPMGEQYAQRLGLYAAHTIQREPSTHKVVRARLWTSSLLRTNETAAHIPHPYLRACDGVVGAPSDAEGDAEPTDDDDAPWEQMSHRVYRQLDEIFAGEYDGLTEAQITALDPKFSDDRRVDKLGTRYPKGESYLDLITRLEPLIHELLSYEEPILVISHQAVLRVLRAYLLHKPRERCFTENIPQHAVMRITWDGWHFPPTPSPREAEMKTRWPPPDSEAWNPATAVPPGDEAIGTEEWVWLGPDTKKSDGQTNL